MPTQLGLGLQFGRPKTWRCERDADAVCALIGASPEEQEAVRRASEAIKRVEAGRPTETAWAIIDRACPNAQGDMMAQSRANHLLYAAIYAAEAKSGSISPGKRAA